MDLLSCIGQFFAGAFLCNAIPHLAAGLQGRAFPTPFAKPRGAGDSSPLVNVLWGVFNAVVGVMLIARSPFIVGPTLGFGLVVVGALVLGVYLSLRFGKVQAAKGKG
ncbi:hypothetical protein ACFJGW_22000 [Burkholderiaceae bacterium UC74_6]